MKYVAPDYEKVVLTAEAVFAQSAGCPEDEFLHWSYTQPCEGTDGYRQVADTYTGLGWGDGCYSSFNP